METVYDGKANCCGCSACSGVCPRNAITMVRDEKGFAYPKVNRELCVDCGLCVKACGNHSVDKAFSEQKFYAAKLHNLQDRMKSRSGGAFYAIASSVLSKDGVVFGAVLNEDITVIHRIGISTEDAQKMQGSKYVESNLNGVYADVAAKLNKKTVTLFSGTPCQVAGLYSYLKYRKCNTNLLYTVDFVCHGVTSALLLKDYVAFISKKFGGKVEEFDFRDKRYGWNSHVETFKIKGKEHTYNNYTSLFYCGRGLRPSCGDCKFANYNRPADISLADFWALDKHFPGFDDNRGVSAIIVNSEKGKYLLNACKDKMVIQEVTKDICSQPCLRHPSEIPADADEFWDTYKKKGFKSILVRYGRYDVGRRIKWLFIEFPRLKRERRNLYL